jgi:hypothetical protein
MRAKFGISDHECAGNYGSLPYPESSFNNEHFGQTDVQTGAATVPDPSVATLIGLVGLGFELAKLSSMLRSGRNVLKSR